MGQMRFLAPRSEALSQDVLDRTYLTGIEGLPWRCRTELQGQEMVVHWPGNESGNLFVPWQVDGHGELLLSTASLMVRKNAYHLPLELARGALSRLRNQAVDFEKRGFSKPDGFDELMRNAMKHFIRAATSQSEPVLCEEAAEQAIRISIDASEQLSRALAESSIKIRKAMPTPPAFILGGAIDRTPPSGESAKGFVSAFNWAAAPLAWRDIEIEPSTAEWSVSDVQIQWSRNLELRICGGPLLRLDHACLPDWVFRLSSFESLQSRVFNHAEQVIRRYQGQVHLWHTSAGMNTGGAAPLSEEQKLRLAVTVIEAAQRADPETPMMISFDQPMCEYLARQDSRLPPMDFADALVRAEMGVAAIGLEINIGYWPEGSLPRDLLGLSRQLDRWGSLGLPLVIMLAAPSAPGEDAEARRATRPLAHAGPNGPSPESQAEYARRLLPMLLSKPFVEGLIWSQFADTGPHAFPHGGVIDAAGRPKPVLDAISRLRREHLA